MFFISQKNAIEKSALDSFFLPKSVAVVGASRDESKIGGIILNNLVAAGFRGQIFPVNRNADSIGLLRAYPSVSDLPLAPDLAIVATPAETVLEVLAGLAKLGTKAAIVISAGFREIGEIGLQREREISEVIKGTGLRVIGPNCLGIFSNRGFLNASFGAVSKKPGRLRLLTQSGAMATSAVDFLNDEGVGISDMVSIGNRLDVSETDILAYWRALDEKNGENFPTGIYLESFPEDKNFLAELGEYTKNHDVIVLKPGRHRAAAVAMRSHTGSLSGTYRVGIAGLRGAGAIVAESLSDFFDLLLTVSSAGSLDFGGKVALITNAGGPGVLAADAASSFGLTLPELSSKTRSALKSALPLASSLFNPIDLLGDATPDRYAAVLQATLRDKAFDVVVPIVTPQTGTDAVGIAQAIVSASKENERVPLTVLIGGEAFLKARLIFRQAGLPVFAAPEQALSAVAQIGRARELKKNRSKDRTRKKSLPEAFLVSANEFLQTKKKLGNSLSYADGIHFLALLGVPVLRGRTIDSVIQAISFVKEQSPAQSVFKISVPGLLHKTEYGGVMVGVHDEMSARVAYQDLMHALKKTTKDGYPTGEIYAEAEAPPGMVEAFVSLKRANSLGDYLVVGPGGTMVELFSLPAIRILPIQEEEIVRAFSETALNRLLSGYRSRPPLASKKLIEVITNLSFAFSSLPELDEVEINPILVGEHSIAVADVKITLR